MPYGDDRRLTNYSLLAGRVVLQDTSIAYTAVPERLHHYLRQQVRWNKSFFRESLWAIRNFRRLRAVWLFTAAELTFWMMAMVSLVLMWLVHPLSKGEVASSVLFFGVAMAYVRSIRYLGSDDVPLRFQLATFAMAPLYSVLSTFLLIPLRLVSLATLRSGAWGTRSRVEVGLQEGGTSDTTAPSMADGPGTSTGAVGAPAATSLGSASEPTVAMRSQATPGAPVAGDELELLAS